RFTAIVLSGGGLRQIAEALAELVARPVAIVDAQGVVQWRTSAIAPELDAADGFSQPIQVGGEHYGTILVAAGADELGPDQLEAIEYAATVAALRQVQSRAVAEADRRFQAVCLEELITGHVTDRSILAERATAFGWDLTIPRAVLLAELDAVEGRPAGPLAGGPEETSLRHRLAEAARASLGPSAIVWERSREIGALVAGLRPPDLHELGAALQAEAGRRVSGATISVGVGRTAAGPLQLDGSFAEARRAMSIGRWAHGPGRVTVFDEIGLDRLLVGMPRSEVADFCASVLGPLEEHDRTRGTSLVETLDTFLASRNAALAARQLYLHYNTLKNRLARIEELIGPYIDDPERCLGLSLAIRLRRLPQA
ncbi:MAG: helix-turn-helix domain-containing protein, partial [Candidatus Limnocylindrales bacterium]